MQESTRTVFFSGLSIFSELLEAVIGTFSRLSRFRHSAEWPEAADRALFCKFWYNSVCHPFSVNEKNGTIYMAVISRRSLFPGNQGHNVDRELWIPRILSHLANKQCVRERCVFYLTLFLSSPFVSANSLYQRSLFLTSFLLPFPTLPFLRRLLSLAKDVCFVNQQSWLKLPLTLNQSRQDLSCLVEI